MTTRRVLAAFLLGALPACGIARAADSPPAEEGTFTSEGARLAYSITWPSGDAEVPGVVLVHGSGQITRSMHSGLVERFVGMGFAVLAYDKRGTGASEGRYSGVGPLNSDTLIPLLARDAARAVEVLAGQSRILRGRVGLAGGSQAGWIIPPASAFARVPVAFGLILVGPTVTVGEEMFYSELVEHGARTVAEGHAALPSFAGPRGFDPMPWVERMHMPTLWLYGDEDRSIPTVACVERFSGLAADLRAWHTVRRYPGLGHGLDSSIWRDVAAWLAHVPT